MILTCKGVTSSSRSLNGGTPQGALLGGIIFIVKFNGALLRPAIPRASILHNSKAETVKYIDDGTAATAIDLKTHLIIDTAHHPRPLTFPQRTGHLLPPQHNLLQKYMEDAEAFTEHNNMRINKKKTTVMKFTNSKKYDFPLDLYYSDGSQVNTTEESKVLGVMISSNLKWRSNTTYICSKARRKLWLLRRLQHLGLSRTDLFDVYAKEVRSILEYAVPVWHAAISKKEASEIESIQKLAFRMILGQSYVSYTSACAVFSADTLIQRRQKICHKFAMKNIKSENCLFSLANTNHNLRNRTKIVNEYKCRTARYQKSSLPFLAKLANEGIL